MKIIRAPLKPGNGRRKIVAAYDSITTQTAHDFMVKAAKDESGTEFMLKVYGGSLSGRSFAMLFKNGKALVKYSQVW